MALNSRSLLILLAKYWIHLTLIFILANVGIFTVLRYRSRAAGVKCYLRSQIVPDAIDGTGGDSCTNFAKCQYIFDSKIFGKGQCAQPHKCDLGQDPYSSTTDDCHPCGQDITNILPFSHRRYINMYLGFLGAIGSNLSAFVSGEAPECAGMPSVPALAGYCPFAAPPNILTWTHDPLATQIRIDRCSGIGCTNFSQVAAIPAPTSNPNDPNWTPSYSDSTVAPNLTYNYRIRTGNDTVWSAASNTLALNTGNTGNFCFTTSPPNPTFTPTPGTASPTPTPTRTPTPTPTNTPIPTFTPTLTPTTTPYSQPTTTPSPIPGDSNNDGKVDGLDYTAWLLNYFTNTQAGPPAGDFNSSGFVDGLDYTIWITNYSP